MKIIRAGYEIMTPIDGLGKLCYHDYNRIAN